MVVGTTQCCSDQKQPFDIVQVLVVSDAKEKMNCEPGSLAWVIDPLVFKAYQTGQQLIMH